MQRDELAAWLRLIRTPGVGNDAARRLLAAFGLPESIFSQPRSTLAPLLSAAQLQAVLEEPPEWSELVEASWAWLQQPAGEDGAERAIVTLGDARYPASLLAMEDPPLLLHLHGQVARLGALAPGGTPAALAVVGSRNPTPQGALNARQFARALAGHGLTIVSGLALGVDGAAHEGALEGHGAQTDRLSTIAVVGTGIDRVYPRQHRDLAHRIVASGLIVSEYPLGTPPLAHNFPRRNRLIAGLSQGTLVVEAALQSGSLITARLAAEQGKEVFAIPGSIHGTQARGCHALIRQGAKLVETAQDVLDELRWTPTPSIATQSIANNQDASPTSTPSPDESAVLQALGADPVGLDALLARTGLDTARLQALLLGLELDGRVGRLPGGLFQRLGHA